ncbi:unannotated protein [freshwater metagenome]|uniref:Unannotated protein n=1 Tax=freshwater metagenome TaxID=449393 RepID=A0A6J7QKF1_9ZZZZ|nr:NADH-quinone oxidoreductase subunit C [Actinomycetota bacterium]MSW36880.1 NADH-quinone oxidoreductase subunit C [Actinomycetota bacterium]
MSALVRAVREVFADDVDDLLDVATDFGSTTIHVDSGRWTDSLEALAAAGATYFDFLTAYDELENGFCVIAHLSTPDASDHVLLRTLLARDLPAIATATSVYRGAAWHERETHEMFGIDFIGNDHLEPLLLPDGFSGTPLRKDFVLASRVVKDWPGAKEPGESQEPTTSRRRNLPPGVPQGWLREESTPPNAGSRHDKA